MLYLKPIIAKMSRTEHSQFQTYLISKNKRKDIKNIELLSLLVREDIEENQLRFLLYKDKTVGAYHGLRKRFSESLIQFYIYYSDKLSKNENDISSLVQAIKKACLTENFDLAKLLLSRAETECRSSKLYLKLQELIDVKLQFAQELNISNVEILFKEFKENQVLLLNEQKWNMAFSWINQVYQKMSFDNQIVNPEPLIKEMFDKFDLGEVKFSSVKTLYQITTIFTQSARLNRDFYSIQEFVLVYYKEFDISKFNLSEDVYFYLELQYLMANIYFRNKNFVVSLELLSKLQKELRFQSEYKTKFQAKVLCLKALNIHFSGHVDEAIELLSSVKNSSILDLDCKLTLVMMLFQNGNIVLAEKYLSQFKHTNSYFEKKVGKEWVIHKQFIAIIIYMEMGRIDKCYDEIRLFQKSHSTFLKETNQERILIFIQLLNDINEHPECITDTEFRMKVFNSIKYHSAEKEDVFMISGYAWLKSKLTDQDLYKTTLDIINTTE